MSDEQKAPQIAIQKVFIKDASYECSDGHEVFKLDKWQPEIKLDLNTATRKTGDDQYEVYLKVNVAAVQDEKTIFMVEIEQGGLFHVAGIEGEELKRVLAAFCPGILYPYAREAVDSLVLKGGFPPVVLAPVNFDALYVQAQQQEAAQGQEH